MYPRRSLEYALEAPPSFSRLLSCVCCLVKVVVLPSGEERAVAASLRSSPLPLDDLAEVDRKDGEKTSE